MGWGHGIVVLTHAHAGLVVILGLVGRWGGVRYIHIKTENIILHTSLKQPWELTGRWQQLGLWLKCNQF